MERLLQSVLLSKEQRQQEESARRLSRYDEAIRLLRLCADEGSPFRLESEEIPAFLATEPRS